MGLFELGFVDFFCSLRIDGVLFKNKKNKLEKNKVQPKQFKSNIFLLA